MPPRTMTDLANAVTSDASAVTADVAAVAAAQAKETSDESQQTTDEASLAAAVAASGPFAIDPLTGATSITVVSPSSSPPGYTTETFPFGSSLPIPAPVAAPTPTPVPSAG